MNTNKPIWIRRSARLGLVVLGLLLAPWFCPLAQAFPPAPYHLIYGVVRDRYGTPLTSAQAQIVLQTQAGIMISAQVVPGLSPGVNYQLKVPMDGSATPDAYLPNALVAATLFKMVVVIGTVTNIPIEMSVSYASLGQPAQSTRIDLTLGVDSNGDGIPDAWENAFLSTLGLNLPLSSLNANSILTPDGRTLHQQYVLGTYPFDPGDPCKITWLGLSGTSPILQFPTITGRSYTVQGSTDARIWIPVEFNFATDAPGTPTSNYYYAPGIATLQVYVVPPPGGAGRQFYRILVQ